MNRMRICNDFTCLIFFIRLLPRQRVEEIKNTNIRKNSKLKKNIPLEPSCSN